MSRRNYVESLSGKIHVYDPAHDGSSQKSLFIQLNDWYTVNEAKILRDNLTAAIEQATKNKEQRIRELYTHQQ